VVPALYRLRPPGGPDGFSALQYMRGDETVVLAYLHAQRFGELIGAKTQNSGGLFRHFPNRCQWH
jgi:hypothetical protein